jgi:hypothetical protein
VKFCLLYVNRRSEATPQIVNIQSSIENSQFIRGYLTALGNALLLPLLANLSSQTKIIGLATKMDE